MAADLFEDFLNWEQVVEKSRKKRDKEFWGNPENRWENQDRTPLCIVQDAMDWKEYENKDKW